MNRVYEELFIVRPDVTEEEVDGIVEPLRGIVTTGGGTVDKVDKWGVRRLAYKVEKRNEGFYVLMQFSSEAPTVVRDVERRLRVNDAVMKFITVRIDEEQKRLDKIKKLRESRKKASAAPPVTPEVGSEPTPATA